MQIVPDKINTAEYKHRIQDYIQYKNIEINSRCNPPKMHCPMPGHDDENPSAVIYEDAVFCPVCDKSLDIFELAGQLNGLDTFPEKMKDVLEALGESVPDKSNSYKKPVKSKPKKSTAEKPDIKIIPVRLQQANDVFSRNKLQGVADYIKKDKKNWGTVKGSWFYYNEDGLIDICDARYDLEDPESKEIKKTIISFYYNGKNISSKQYPVLLYNRHLLAEDDKKPILVVEGAKTASAASVLTDFIPVTWNGGGKKAYKADWSILKNRKVYIFPDDDEPGVKTAIDIQEILYCQYKTESKIIKPINKLREIKAKGADIVEALQIFTPEKLTEYIYNCEDISLIKNNTKTSESREPEVPDAKRKDRLNPSVLPFRMLGVADDGKAYFIDRSHRLQKYTLSSLNKSQLLMLASRKWWIFSSHFGGEGKIYWDNAIDYIIEVSNSIDFDSDKIRGRGAWRDYDNLIYHDGKKTHGKTDPENIYLRKKQEDIGIFETSLDYKTRKIIRDIVCSLSFETKADAIRCLAWSTLAPFGGCLTWRPAVLVTGPSGSGKTTVANNVIRKIANPVWLDGSESTPAGVRGMVQNDTCSVVFEEAECDTPKKRENRTNLFSLMRTNTSDDAPDAAKGTADGGVRSYKMRNMFCFIAISPEIDSVADENRVFKINLKKPDSGSWVNIQEKLNYAMTENNCRKLRAFVWSVLEKIMQEVSIIIPVLQKITKKDYRYCYAEALLLSAYFNVWTDIKITEKNIKGVLKDFYDWQPLEATRDETEELVDRLLDESIIVTGPSDRRTFREVLQAIFTNCVVGSSMDENVNVQLGHKEVLNLRNVVHRYGLDVSYQGEIFISNNHHEIMSILDKGRGYHIQLARHRNCIDKSRVAMIAKKSRRCTVIANVFEDVSFDVVDSNNKEIPF